MSTTSTIDVPDSAKPQENEYALVGSAFHATDADETARAVGLIEPANIFNTRAAIVGEAVRAVYAAARRVDTALVVDELQRRGLFKEIGGFDGLLAFIEGVPNASNVANYAAVVNEAAARRRTLEAAFNVQRAVAGADPETIRGALAAMGEAAKPIDKRLRFAAVTAADLIAHNPTMRDAIIDGVLHRREVGNFVSGPKAFKTFALIDLAIAIAMGWAWLGFPCRRGRVLLLDFELHPDALAKRVQAVLQARGITAEDLGDRLVIETMRGRAGVNVDTLIDYARDIGPGRFDCAIIDPAYKTHPPDFDENSNAMMADFYRKLGDIADALDAALVLSHHASKGVQADKSVTDSGAGAGAQSRAADAHLVLRPHEEDDCSVLAGVVRTFAGFAPRGLRWTYPVWSVDPSLDPEALLKTGRRSRKVVAEVVEPVEPVWTCERFAAEFITAEPKPRSAIIGRAVGAGLANRRAEALLNNGEAIGLIHRWKVAKDNRCYFANAAQPNLERGSQ